MLSALLAELCLDAAPHRVNLIGHSHVALSFERPRASRQPARRAARRPSSTSRDGEWLLNPGSVGQPRDGDPRAAWLLLDTDGCRQLPPLRVRHRRGGRARSARRACRTRSPSAWSTGSEAALATTVAALAAGALVVLRAAAPAG